MNNYTEVPNIIVPKKDFEWFINNVFDDWYKNDCENIQIISKDEI